MTKRGKLEIMKDILKLVQDNNSIKPTPLSRKSNLSSKRFKEYYIELIGKNLIKETINSNHEKHVSLTENGFRFLDKYKTIISFIDEFEL